MEIVKHHKISLLSAVVAVALSGCNDIDDDERFIPLPPIEGNRVVLLEDYTGQSCPNCPEGHRVIHQLEQQYPGKVVAVSIHGGEFAIPVSNPTYVGLKPEFGDAMCADRGIDVFPSGIVDGSVPTLHTGWATAVYNALQRPALCEIEVTDLSYDDATRRLDGSVSLLPGKSVEGALGIWILEDGIVARQYNVNGDHTWDRKYVHDYVLRGYATSTVWGDHVSLGREEETVRNFSVAIDPAWNPENISVVAFVTDMATGEYLQTTQAYVNQKNEQN